MSCDEKSKVISVAKPWKHVFDEVSYHPPLVHLARLSDGRYGMEKVWVSVAMGELLAASVGVAYMLKVIGSENDAPLVVTQFMRVQCPVWQPHESIVTVTFPSRSD